MVNRLPAIVIDNGTGYTKLGYAENKEPQFIIPSGERLTTRAGGFLLPDQSLCTFLGVPQRTVCVNYVHSKN